MSDLFSEPDDPSDSDFSPSSEMERLLVSISCDDHIAVFREHEIDIDAALQLKDEELKELFPKIGQRIRFKKKLAAYSDTIPMLPQAKSLDDTLTSKRDVSQEIADIQVTAKSLDDKSLESALDGLYTKYSVCVYKLKWM